MNPFLFFVVRVFYEKDGKETHSIQSFDTETQAKKRFHSIIAADVDSEAITYELVQIIRDDGRCMASEVFGERGVTA